MTLLHGVKVTVLVERRDQNTGISALVDDRVIENCALEPVNQTVNDPTRESVTTRSVLYTPPGSRLVAGNRVRLPDGTVWEVTVDADSWRSPFTGWAPGDRVSLTRVRPPP